MDELRGKRVLITGASSGIGIATAQRFAQRGANLALIARGEGLAEAGRRARSLGVQAHEMHADVADRADLRRSVTESIAALGGLDVAVLNVGVATYGPFEKTAPEDFDRVIDVTFRSAVDTVRLVLPALERSGGTLVLTGSVASKVPYPLMSSYVAAKHALRGFVGALRIELAARRSEVKVAMVHPGPVDTPFFDHVATTPGRTPVKLHGFYSAPTVARALVEMAVHPRREFTIGGLMLAWEAGNLVARPGLERALALGARALRPDPSEEGRPGALRRPSGNGEVGAGMFGRPSVWGELQLAPRRLLRAVRR